MAKKNNNKPKNSSAEPVATAEIAVPLTPPGQILGLLVFLLCVVFTVVYLAQQGLQDRDDVSAGTVAEPLDGFREDLWYLPDEPLLGFVEIPAGPFLMGSDSRADRLAYDNERWLPRQAQGRVELPVYYVARYETTVSQFHAYIQDAGLNTGAEISAVGNLPVTGVTWPEALAYGRWLEQQLRGSSDTPAALQQFFERGGRVTLPTEAEWEKAARGDRGRIFPWGAQVRTDMANYNSPQLLPVGALPCPLCSYGLSDMAGNVWELTRSPFQDYPFTPDDDMDTLAADALWVMRGGSFADPVNNVRAAVRGGVDPGVRNPGIGFRLVISTQ